MLVIQSYKKGKSQSDQPEFHQNITDIYNLPSIRFTWSLIKMKVTLFILLAIIFSSCANILNFFGSEESDEWMDQEWGNLDDVDDKNTESILINKDSFGENFSPNETFTFPQVILPPLIAFFES